MTHARYTIGELAKAAGTTPRTVRYYVAEGLLPPPRTKGRYAVYTDVDLRRLELIGRLKAAFLPLNAIRTQLGSLSDDEIAALLKQTEALPASQASPVRVKTTEPHSEQGGVSYLAQILAVTGQFAKEKEGETDAPLSHRKRALLFSPALQNIPSDNRTAETQSEDHDLAGVAWQRIAITPNLELHFQATSNREEAEKLRTLIDYARSLFLEPPA